MINIIPVEKRKTRKAFINFPYQLYKNDPHWVPHLKIERNELINPKKNPYFENARAQMFVAEIDGKTVGRISAQVNELHNKRYDEKTGHFGYFDCIENEDVASALFKAAESWLKEQGMTKAVGPYSLSINEEVGVLIEGFGSSPFPMMTHNYPYYSKLIENLGYQKAKDLIAWHYDVTAPIPEAAQQITDAVLAYPNLTIREIDKKNYMRDLNIVREIFNSAWSNNWGFIPLTEAEFKKTAKDLKMILDPRMALIAEVKGEPAAIAVAFPNYHEAIHDLNGHLFPFGIFKLLYRVKTKKIKSIRLCLLGIKKEFRQDVLAGLSVCLYTLMHKRGQEMGVERGELSWTLDDNDKINKGISLMGGVPYKTYRVFEKSL